MIIGIIVIGILAFLFYGAAVNGKNKAKGNAYLAKKYDESKK